MKLFPKKYHTQIKSNFARVIEDTSGGIPLEKKHLNAWSMVRSFNAIFNKRESDEDKTQALEAPNTSDQQFIDDSDESPEKKKPSKKRPM